MIRRWPPGTPVSGLTIVGLPSVAIGVPLLAAQHEDRRDVPGPLAGLLLLPLWFLLFFPPLLPVLLLASSSSPCASSGRRCRARPGSGPWYAASSTPPVARAPDVHEKSAPPTSCAGPVARTSDTKG